MDKKEINQQKDAEQPQEITRLDFIRSMIADCRYDDALEMLQIATEDEPDNVDYNYELARIFMELGNYSSAVSNLELVLEKNQSSLLYFMLGEAYQADGELDKAIGAYLKANAVNENFPFAYKKLGMLFMARGDMESAIEYFEDYLKLDIAEDEKDSVGKILERIKK